jgi:hypothetical protein
MESTSQTDQGLSTRFHELDRFYRSNRSCLACWIRSYYVGCDIEPQFPLLVQPGWILEKPLKLDFQTESSLLRWAQVENLTIPTFDSSGFRFHRLRQQLNPSLRFRGGSSYRLINVSVSSAGSQTLTFGLGEYLDHYDTCEAAGFEAASWYTLSSGGKTFPDYHGSVRHAPNDAFDFNKRVAVAGISTLFISLNSGDDIFFYHVRDDALGEAPGTLSVVPAGTFEPATPHDGNHVREFSFLRNVEKEASEELFGQSEDQSASADGAAFPLADLISDGRARLFYFGLGLDPLTTKPEILTCVVIRMEELSSLGLSIENIPGNHEGKIVRAKLKKNELFDLAKHEQMLPAGASCLMLAGQHFQTLIGQRA